MSERDSLKAIRLHRYRREAWRHAIRVRRARAVALGLLAIALTVAVIWLDPRHDATFALLSVPIGVALIMQ